MILGRAASAAYNDAEDAVGIAARADEAADASAAM